MENFKKMSLGGKVITISALVAILSLFMDWVDGGIVSENGFQQEGYIFLAFYIYPIVIVLKNKRINKVLGIISSGLAIIFSIMFINSKSVDFFGLDVNLAAIGLYIFVSASIGLLFGCVKYHPILSDASIGELNSFFCSNCGHKNSTHSAFCSGCGKQIKEKSTND